MKIGGLTFEVKDKKVYLTGQGEVSCLPKGFIDVQIAGKPKPTPLGIKTAASSEKKELEYVESIRTENSLIITQKSNDVLVKTYFTSYENTSTVRIFSEITNITDNEIVLEEVSAFSIKNIFDLYVEHSKQVNFTKFYQSHHAECQPKRQSFFDWSLTCVKGVNSNRIFCANVGSQSSKQELPFGIIDDGKNYLAFEIESNHSWLYDLCDEEYQFCLWLGSAHLHYLNWAKKLAPNESYKTVSVAVAINTSLNGVMADITNYRRQISKRADADKNLPVIFNEYMWLSWDSPSEERTKKYAPAVAKTGCEYYVIDCGWHDEVDGSIIYPYVGRWIESKARFPHGVKATTDFIRSLGMKAGLWIEPEVVGIKCKEMLDYYDDDCFIQRFGKKIIASSRYILDYRNQKVRSYMTETIRRMVEDYGADYVKFDYNQDFGVGTDLSAFTFGEGLEQSSTAFLSWVDEIRAKFPSVVFENCSSGGNRLDYQSLSRFDLASTSDCTDFAKYAYISANFTSALIPEQSGVWCYPMGGVKEASEVSDERVVMNIINTLLGRMHLASDISELNTRHFDLIKQGVSVYKQIVEFKKSATPYLPLGFIEYGSDIVSAGLIKDKDLYLAVWCLNSAKSAEIPLDKEILDFSVAYPLSSSAKIKAECKNLSVDFERELGSVLIKIKLK